MSSDASSAQVNEWILGPEQEFRMEVDSQAKLQIKRGTAELFGTELVEGYPYTFEPGRKIAIFTWHGCTIAVTGTQQPTVAYTAEETPMRSYLNLHLALQQAREFAKQNTSDGPKVIILGPTDVGKTSLSHILINYAVKQGARPLLVDLDTNEGGSLTLPGCISAAVISRPVDVEDGLGASAVVTGSTPSVWYYGYTTILEKKDLYKTLTTKLAESALKKLQEDSLVRWSGMIVDTPSQFTDPQAEALLENTVDKFGVNSIVIIGNERMYARLTQQYINRPELSIIKLAKSGGVVDKTQSYRRTLTSRRIREYFYGTPKSELSPHSSTLPYSELVVRRVGLDGAVAPSSALPIGQERILNPEARLSRVEPSAVLLHSILAMSNASLPELGSRTQSSSKEEDEKIIGHNLAGFVHVSDVDDVKKKITILTPNPGRLPRKYLIMGALKWVEL
ncbi:hypothetical protein SeMB42_g00148 [Synchytrium endobioticum]|uniref:Polynucleotide 5'-hydroxyl-kinase GRC3 n=1 Tax=Synchytrium endobioticum TaxID=286115 RepID=A0A507DT76_9FUNG|nr:hypothetical protein SeLEV6574_g01089 [Synchytrium endobioticum]TPX54639.1 hypothetical protein SeMB42_g00150 [Synchytrium endobioticum]TPX54671.1 hypothetical protein SeMB42_g00148 [Synchytrium endobioticum]